MPNLFKTYTASGQSTINASSPTDILNLVAGNGVALATNPIQKKVSFNSGNSQGVIKTHPPVITTTSFSISTLSTWTNWPGMTTTITPASINSKFLFYFSSEVGWGGYNTYGYVSLFANGVNITQGDIAGPVTQCWCDAACGIMAPNNGWQLYNTKPISGFFAYSPATTSPITFQLKVILTLSGPIIFGRSWNLSDANRSSIPSTLIIEETL